MNTMIPSTTTSLEATDPDRLPNPLIRTAELLQRPVIDENGMCSNLILLLMLIMMMMMI
jgi:hypothetical protein